MLPKPPSCEGCPLFTLGEGFMRPRGTGHYGVMLIGEALGQREAEAGSPFIGPAGKTLREACDWGGLDPDGFTIANAVWCRPPNNELEGQPYEPGATAHCYTAHLKPLIDTTNPKVLVPMGKVATRSLLGLDQILRTRGYVYRKDGRLVLPTIHPSFIQRGQTKWMQVLIHDLQRAVEIARDGWSPAPTSYLLDPSVEGADGWAALALASPTTPIAYDIETPGKDEDEGESTTNEAPKPIIRISFAYAPGRALSIPFSKRFHPVIHRLLESPNPKIVWNGAFDNPRLLAQGFPISGLIHDGMVAWHVLHSDLPKGLGFVATMLCPKQAPWKHLSRELPAYYNAVDSDVEWQATHTIFDLLKQCGLWTVYERHVLEIDKLFTLMAAAGMPIDMSIRLAKATELTNLMEAIDVEVQAAVPPEVCPIHPKGGYKKKRPADDDDPVSWVQLPTGLWARRLPFVPSAGTNGGLVRYQDHLGHAPVYTEGKRTTNEAALQTLRIRYPADPLYPIILRRREVEKIGGTYTGWIEEGKLKGGLRTRHDGRVVYSFSHNPSTLRVSCIGGLQQIPRATALGAVVKAFFVAPPNHSLIEVDYAGIEALLVGHFAGSPSYSRLARLGVHDYVNAFALRDLDGILTDADMPDLAWSDADLAAYFKDLKRRFKAERDVRKRLVHGRNYLMGWKEAQQVLLKEQGRAIPAADIKRFLRFYSELFPEIGAWQWRLCETVGGVEAEDLPPGHTTWVPNPLGSEGPGWVRNPYGYLHRYNKAIAWERIGNKWEARLGPDAKRLVAFKPQSTAAAILKEAMLRIRDQEPEILSYLRLMIHDSLVAEAPTARAEWVASRMAQIMQQPNPELGGLWVATEGKVGQSWLMTE